MNEVGALGALVAIVGLGLAMNVARLAESLAERNRPFPWWVKWPLTDSPVGYRIVGVGLAVMGAMFAVFSARGT